MRLRRLEKRDAEGMLEWMGDSEIQKAFRFHAKQKDKKSVLAFIENADLAVTDGRGDDSLSDDIYDLLEQSTGRRLAA